MALDFSIGNVNNVLKQKLPQVGVTPSPTPNPLAGLPSGQYNGSAVGTMFSNPANHGVTPPPAPSYGNASATSPAKASYINDLTSKFGNVGGTIYNKSTGQGYSDPASFFKDAGVSSFGGLKFDTQYNPSDPGMLRSAGNTVGDPGMGRTADGTLTDPGMLKGAPPTATATPYDNYQTAIKDYIASLTPDNSVSDARKKYQDYVASAQLGINNIEGQGRGIPLALVRGQQAKLGAQAQIEANRLQGDVGIAQDQQTANQQLAATKYGLNTDAFNAATSQQDKATKAQQDAEKFAFDNNVNTPFYNVGGTVYSTATGKAFSTPEEAFAAGVKKDFSNAPVISKPKTPVELSEGAALVDPVTGKVLYKNPKTYAPGTGSSSSGGLYTNPITGQAELSPLAQAVQNGTIAITSLSVKNRDAVAAELAAFGQQSGRQQELATNLQLVDEILNSGKVGQITGIPDIRSFIPGTSVQKTKNQLTQLKSNLSLENRQKLKGSGAISDFEFKVLSDAASALGNNLSDKDTIEQLQKVKDVFAGKYATTTSGSPGAGVTVQAPDGKFYTFPDQASANAFKKQVGL